MLRLRRPRRPTFCGAPATDETPRRPWVGKALNGPACRLRLGLNMGPRCIPGGVSVCVSHSCRFSGVALPGYDHHSAASRFHVVLRDTTLPCHVVCRRSPAHHSAAFRFPVLIRHRRSLSTSCAGGRPPIVQRHPASMLLSVSAAPSPCRVAAVARLVSVCVCVVDVRHSCRQLCTWTRCAWRLPAVVRAFLRLAACALCNASRHFLPV